MAAYTLALLIIIGAKIIALYTHYQQGSVPQGVPITRAILGIIWLFLFYKLYTFIVNICRDSDAPGSVDRR